jgi:hypothetical protein
LLLVSWVWFAATPFTQVAAEDVGSHGDGQRPRAFETACDAAELAQALVANTWFCQRVLEIPNYLEPVLTNLTVAMQHGRLEGSAAANAAVVLTLLTQTPPGQMVVLRRHPHLAQFFLALDSCFAHAPQMVSTTTRVPRDSGWQRARSAVEPNHTCYPRSPLRRAV